VFEQAFRNIDDALRITTKVKTKLHLTAFDPEPGVGEPKFLDEWYVNHITVNRKRYFIFTEALTLFSHIVSSNQINARRRFEELATDILFHHVKPHAEISQALFESIASKIVIGKTNNRRILGSQNELVWMAQARDARFDEAEFDEVNDTPLSMLEYSPRDAFEKELRRLTGQEETLKPRK